MKCLLEDIRSCTNCRDLPLGPRPILQAHPDAKLLIVGQAPGRKTHAKGIPFDDPSGERLRNWLGLGRELFYSPNKIAIVPMGFCFPGTGTSGDLPPRVQCSLLWRRKILDQLSAIELTLIIGRYALDWHLPQYRTLTITQAVKTCYAECTDHIILPHPSPRNNRWLAQNPWFNDDVIPALQNQIKRLKLDQ